MSETGTTPALQPLRKSIAVERDAAGAFRLFTEGMARWWPLATHSIGGEKARGCGIESRVGGAVFEVDEDGERCAWGAVLVWEPPERFVMSWHPGRASSTAQEVEVRFIAEGARTRVELEHRGWEHLGEGAAETREAYDGGWQLVLGRCFAEACATPEVAPS